MAGGQAIDGAKRGTLFVLPPEKLKLVTDKKHSLYDERVERPVREDLVVSIMHFGVLVPIHVNVDGDDILVVDGRGRVKAALEANRRLKEKGGVLVNVKCLVDRGNPAKLFALVIATNECRVDDTPLEKAKKAQRLLEMVGSEEAVGAAFGVTEQAVKKWLALLDMPAPIRTAVEKGQLSANQASQLAKQPKEAQTAGLAELKLAANNGVSPKRAAKAVMQNGPRMKAKKVIEQRLEEKNLPKDYRLALEWVLGRGD